MSLGNLPHIGWQAAKIAGADRRRSSPLPQHELVPGDKEVCRHRLGRDVRHFEKDEDLSEKILRGEEGFKHAIADLILGSTPFLSVLRLQENKKGTGLDYSKPKPESELEALAETLLLECLVIYKEWDLDHLLHRCLGDFPHRHRKDGKGLLRVLSLMETVYGKPLADSLRNIHLSGEYGNGKVDRAAFRNREELVHHRVLVTRAYSYDNSGMMIVGCRGKSERQLTMADVSLVNVRHVSLDPDVLVGYFAAMTAKMLVNHTNTVDSLRWRYHPDVEMDEEALERLGFRVPYDGLAELVFSRQKVLQVFLENLTHELESRRLFDDDELDSLEEEKLFQSALEE
jgi:hypothetical protein